MIWTTPLGTELGSLPVVELSPVLQARSLSIACAYLRSLDVQAALALTGNQCPGKLGLGGGGRVGCGGKWLFDMGSDLQGFEGMIRWLKV